MDENTKLINAQKEVQAIQATMLINMELLMKRHEDLLLLEEKSANLAYGGSIFLPGIHTRQQRRSNYCKFILFLVAVVVIVLIVILSQVA